MRTGSATREHRRGETPPALLLVLPGLLGLILFIGLPFLLAIGMSFTDLRMGSPLPLEWAGLRQYFRIFADDAFLRALLNNLMFAAVTVPVQTSLALGLALLLNRQLRGMAVFRVFFFMPVVFPLSLVSVIWVLIYAPGPDGALNALLELLTLGAWEPVDYLHHPGYALPAVMLTSIWQGVGFQMVVLLAGLQAIPAVLFEAAAIDGANARQRFWHVILPQLRNPLIFVVVVTSIFSFRVFDQIRIMTQGGPNDASTTLIFEAVQAAFDRAQVARGAAISVVFFLVVMGITMVQRKFLKQEGEVS